MAHPPGAPHGRCPGGGRGAAAPGPARPGCRAPAAACPLAAAAGPSAGSWSQRLRPLPGPAHDHAPLLRRRPPAAAAAEDDDCPLHPCCLILVCADLKHLFEVKPRGWQPSWSHGACIGRRRQGRGQRQSRQSTQSHCLVAVAPVDQSPSNRLCQDAAVQQGSAGLLRPGCPLSVAVC